jgi:tartrate dehydratase beta subunit/fumarate hydratase class I family protein
MTGELETTTPVVIENITVNDTISMTGELVTTRAVVIESITINDTIYQ